MGKLTMKIGVMVSRDLRGVFSSKNGRMYICTGLLKSSLVAVYRNLETVKPFNVALLLLGILPREIT